MRKLLVILTMALLLLGFFMPGLATIEPDEPLPKKPVAAEERPDPETAIPLATPEDLLAIRNNPKGRYQLQNHIDMSGVNWTPIPFSGVLDGQGYAIYNLTIAEVGQERRDSFDGNRVKYDTVYAGLFSVMEQASVKDLTLLGLVVNITTEENCFIGGLAGFTHLADIDHVLVDGRLSLTMNSRMGGTGGIVGFGDGLIQNSAANVELVFLDTQRYRNCEQFLGGITACGYTDLDACHVVMKGFASIHGFAHNGGLMGMYHVHDNKIRKEHGGFVNNCTVDAHIRFFENNKKRRAYCRRFVGEPLHRTLVMDNNEFTFFKRDEVTNYRVNLLPEMDENPVYESVTTPPTDTDFGYTTHTCTICGYAYRDSFTMPLGTAE